MKKILAVLAVAVCAMVAVNSLTEKLLRSGKPAPLAPQQVAAETVPTHKETMRVFPATNSAPAEYVEVSFKPKFGFAKK